jgi:hypothetical protein
VVNCTFGFFFLFIFLVFIFFCNTLPPFRAQPTVLPHAEFAVGWGEAGFEPVTAALQLGALPLSNGYRTISYPFGFCAVAHCKECFELDYLDKSEDI